MADYKSDEAFKLWEEAMKLRQRAAEMAEGPGKQKLEEEADQKVQDANRLEGKAP